MVAHHPPRQYLQRQHNLERSEETMTTSSAERQKGGVAAGLVEYQMRFRELISRAAERGRATPAPATFGPYLTISREAGSKGAAMARAVGERLGWSVLDKELVNGLADDLKLEPEILELMDETRSNWFSETLLNLFNSRLVLQHSYVDLVGKVVALAAAEGRVVIVGRGAHLILPPVNGLRVRIVAPAATRSAEIAESAGLDERAARRQIDEIDANRQDFIRRHFRRDAADASQYDLVLNSGSLGVEVGVEIIIRTMERKALVTG
jgi:cytidylate kinase